MSTNNPKFLKLAEDKIVKYTIKVDENLLDKYRELANLTDKQINQTINQALESYLDGKTVFNTYLDTFKSFYINIPYNLLVKSYITKSSYDDITNLYKSNRLTDFNNMVNIVNNYYAEEIANIEERATLFGQSVLDDDELYKEFFTPDLYTHKNYKVIRVPNNLDKWNDKTNTYSSYYKYEDDNINTGLEFVIIPEIAEYTDDFTNCLYCFYFELIGNHDLTVISIEYLEALDLIEEAGSNYLFNLINNIYSNLEEATSIEAVKEYADFYNTGNIIKISDMDTEEVEPIKLYVTRKNETSINYHDKQILKKVERLEKENKELKEEITKAMDLIKWDMYL